MTGRMAVLILSPCYASMGSQELVSVHFGCSSLQRPDMVFYCVSLTRHIVGKSVLASRIVEDLRSDSSKAVAYFYCKDKDEQRSRLTPMLNTLSNQLLCYHDDLVPYFYDECLKKAQTILTDSKLAKKLFEVLAVEISKTVTIVIDGLDECEKAERASILAFITELVKKTNNQRAGALRVLIVSQDEVDIRRMLQGATVLELSGSDVANDIKLFTAAQFKNIGIKFGLSPEEEHDAVAAVCGRTQGRHLDL